MLIDFASIEPGSGYLGVVMSVDGEETFNEWRSSFDSLGRVQWTRGGHFETLDFSSPAGETPLTVRSSPAGKAPEPHPKP